MLFSSITFLYYFLPIVLAVYFLAPRRGKYLVLLLASLVFYWWGEPRYVFLMLFTIAFAYVCGLLIGRFRGRGAAKGFLILSVAGELAVLGYFKYADFFLSTVTRSALQRPIRTCSAVYPSSSPDAVPTLRKDSSRSFGAPSTQHSASSAASGRSKKGCAK